MFRYPQLELLFERLAVTAEDGSGLLLTGRAGCGKTTATRAFLSSLDAKYRVIYLGQFQHGGALFAALGSEFGIRSNMWGKKRMLYLSQNIARETASGRRIVLVIDEAHLLDRATFEDLRLLTNADMDSRSPMSLIVIGQRWLRSTLRNVVHEALYQRLRLRFALEGMSQKENSEYIWHHLQLSGCTKMPFTKDALKSIFVASEGILREVNNICYEALLAGAEQNEKQIDGRIVEWVIDQRELA
jgi:general secretion pathway protein A